MSHNLLRRVVVGLGVAAAALALGGLSSTPALAADPGADLTKTLHVSMKFTQTIYHAGDIAHLTVTLANSDSSPLRGVKATCPSQGFSPIELRGTGPGWAPLTNGVDLAAGETKTVDVWETVPSSAADYAAVRVGCSFGPNAPSPANILPTAQAQAKVFGTPFYYSVWLFASGSGPIVNTKVYALDPDTRQIVGRAVTDGTGVLEFKGIPAGPYELYVVGPWQGQNGQPIMLYVKPMPPKKESFFLEPGPNKPDLEPTGGTSVPATSASSTPTSSTSTSAGVGAGGTASSTTGAVATTTVSAAAAPKTLPNTGADVFVPMVAGLALLAVGAGALLIVRRRKALS